MSTIASWSLGLALIGVVFLLSVGMNRYPPDNKSTDQEETENRRKAALKATASMHDFLVLNPVPSLNPVSIDVIQDILTKLCAYKRDLERDGITRAEIDNIRLELEDIREDLNRMKRK